MDAQAQGFEEAQAGAVEELRQELMDAGELGDDAADFVPGEHGGQVLGLFGAHSINGIEKLLLEDVAIEEEQGGEGLTSTSSVQGFCVEAATCLSTAR